MDKKKLAAENRWTEARRKYMERNGQSGEEVLRWLREGKNAVKELLVRDKDAQRQEQYNKIQNSTATSTVYKTIMGKEGRAQYLRKKDKNHSQCMIARL